MEQPPLPNLLISIPSQASNLAMACVGHILEDQIGNPQQMVHNLKKISSVVNDWGLALSGDMNAAGDAVNSFYGFGSGHQAWLLKLPLKVRHKIWSLLSNMDILNLRLVNSQIQFEIDHGFGLPVIMDTDLEEPMLWLQQVTTRKCFVTNLTNFIYFNFLPKPDQMLSLRFHHDVVIFPETLELILRKFPCIRDVAFHNKDNMYELIDREFQLVRPTETKKFLTLATQTNLTGIRLLYDEQTFTLDWKLEFHPSPTSRPVDTGYIRMKIPQKEKQIQVECLSFLEQQYKLYELQSELSGANWTHYEEPILRNSKTLTGLYLLGLECSFDNPFDFSVLKNCSNLSYLTVSGFDTNSTVMPYLPVVGAQWLFLLKSLSILTMNKVYLPASEFKDMEQITENKVWIRITESLVGENEIFKVNLGEMNTENSSKKGTTKILTALDDYEETSIYDDMVDYCYNNDGGLRQCCNNQCCQRQWPSGFTAQLMQGILITAWLALC